MADFTRSIALLNCVSVDALANNSNVSFLPPSLCATLPISLIIRPFWFSTTRL